MKKKKKKKKIEWSSIEYSQTASTQNSITCLGLYGIWERYGITCLEQWRHTGDVLKIPQSWFDPIYDRLSFPMLKYLKNKKIKNFKFIFSKFLVMERVNLFPQK